MVTSETVICISDKAEKLACLKNLVKQFFFNDQDATKNDTPKITSYLGQRITHEIRQIKKKKLQKKNMKLPRKENVNDYIYRKNKKQSVPVLLHELFPDSEPKLMDPAQLSTAVLPTRFAALANVFPKKYNYES